MRSRYCCLSLRSMRWMQRWLKRSRSWQMPMRWQSLRTNRPPSWKLAGRSRQAPPRARARTPPQVLRKASNSDSCCSPCRQISLLYERAAAACMQPRPVFATISMNCCRIIPSGELTLFTLRSSGSRRPLSAESTSPCLPRRSPVTKRGRAALTAAGTAQDSHPVPFLRASSL